jgi:hypothetical protein
MITQMFESYFGTTLGDMTLFFVGIFILGWVSVASAYVFDKIINK